MNQNSHTLSSATDDEGAIRSLYQQLMDGWNAASGDAFAAPFEEDGDLVGFDGTHIKGRQEIASFHQHLFDMFLKGSRLVGKVRSVRFLTSNVAVMHAVGGTVMTGESDLERERNSVQTLVAVKRNGKWSLAAFQNTRAIYMGRPEESQKLTEELRALL
ncbi:MAG TPA: SgcJ/EcaC family oxidoreductase [Nitrososphaeraceae archaeon]|nr:SgcJ/EcaC family oxidoreductase [Nitrososphaeraceae archaeon]